MFYTFHLSVITGGQGADIFKTPAPGWSALGPRSWTWWLTWEVKERITHNETVEKGSAQNETLTEDVDLDRGLGLLVAVPRHTLVDPGAVHVGMVYGEGRRGFITAAHKNVRPVGKDLLPAGSVPVNVFSISHHWKRKSDGWGNEAKKSACSLALALQCLLLCQTSGFGPPTLFPYSLEARPICSH